MKTIASCLMLLTGATLLAACDPKASTAPPPPIELAGISLGMSMDAYRTVVSKPPGFQIGGVVGAPEAAFIDGKLAKFNWRFPSEKYMVVQRALVNQFPEMKCEAANQYQVCVAKGEGAVYLSEGQRGNWSSHVWLERGVRGGN
jgi:hypothetical protein